MNLFGNGVAGDGSNRLLRTITLAGGIISVGALIATATLDSASRNKNSNWVSGLGSSFGKHNKVARSPQPVSQRPRIGIRYGNVDYMPTATIPGKKSRIKNVIADPSLGMPR